MKNNILTVAAVILVFVAGAFFIKVKASSYVNDQLSSVAEETPILQPQTSAEGEVTVEVRPLELDKGKSPTFEVVLNTHSVELDADLKKDVVMIVEGKEYIAFSYEGDPPGGHHRTGVVSFSALATSPRKIEIIVKNVGGVGERRFAWEITR